MWCFSALQRAENSSMRSIGVGNEFRLVSFSALQRAENSSIFSHGLVAAFHVQFQCSSASRKFLNARRKSARHHRERRVSVLFSEPKIPQYQYPNIVVIRSAKFQCSSASRKFLNAAEVRRVVGARRGFSALQRAENSSIKTNSGMRSKRAAVSVLFSEPKIPQ